MSFARVVAFLLLVAAHSLSPSSAIASRRTALKLAGGAAASFAGVVAANAKEYPKMSAEEAQARYGAPSAATSAAKKKLRAEGKAVPKIEAVRGPGGSYGV